ncbi:LacI family DNA-binding transcriptional regulator [Paenibacillus riograndensis]|uniref:Transcriptional regulator, LacI family (HTH and periplasmic-binding domains) n=2 Tax=Paenibacillus riograndensis TaxID=483937 RepID=A0A0E4H9B3_9BACL|nr:LacI family DNA-binding transcriptional regulator [Paenibacillus riograndensis]CQR54095.1 Transcriptional regulator, LacI family (HTH and periplasmic-binding domains) [Paenibacillus riograndensis SBR5]
MVSIKDVAKHAGVSISAVSKTLNGYSDVSEATRRKILQAAQELNYSPNMLAKNLKHKVTKTIALIISNFEKANGKDGVVFQIISGVYAAATRYGYEVVIYTRSLSEQQDKSYWQFCNDHKIAGVVISGLRTTDPYFEELIDSDIPSVVIDAETIGPHAGSVITDNLEAARLAVQYLISKGHQEIGMVNGHRYATVSIKREQGYREALEEAGLTFIPSRVVEADFTEEGAYELTEGFISANPRLTAVFVASDLMAIGVMKRITELGLRVPEDISLMGFDDIVLCSYTTPKLSTIRQDFVGLGYAALEQVVKMLERNTPGYNKILPFSIVDRETIMIL